jgi:hypothetical protein
MHTPSIRTLTALSYERGEEFDPALMLSPALAEQLDGSTASGTTDFAPSPTDRGIAFWSRADAGRTSRTLKATRPSSGKPASQTRASANSKCARF